MFRVRAVYDYDSPHDDDLSFANGQIITVTEEEDADWYVGEYTDDSGTKHDGLFPRNFVEKYEPAPPPRPNRAPRPKPEPAAPAAPAAPATPHEPAAAAPHAPEPELDAAHNELRDPEPAAEPIAEPAPEPEPEPSAPAQTSRVEPPPPIDVDRKPSVASPLSPTSPRSADSIPNKPAPAPASAPKKAPPPIAAKSNAFRDRIAAFNQPAAAPVQPFKPSPSGGTSFIRKPFVAPPPSRNAYVPPPKEAPQAKTYRRDEDPEIADRQAQDQEAAERSGLSNNAPANEGEDEGPKLSLKERIALLQKQQQEQAERAAGVIHKEKPKKPPMRKRTESHEGAEDSEDTELEKIPTATSASRTSTDHGRPRTSHDIKSPESLPDRDIHSDANDADQSGAGETEDQSGDSTSVEGDDRRTPAPAPALPAREPDVGDEQDVEEEEEEEEEEDEMDAEARRKLELRERMAKMSGGMGMPGMFGGMPMGGLPPKKKKSTGDKKAEESEQSDHPAPQRVAMFPMPGMPAMPAVRSPEAEDRRLSTDIGEHSQSIDSTIGRQSSDPVPNEQEMPTPAEAPPVPSDSKLLIPRKPIATRPALAVHQSSLEIVSKTYSVFDGSSEYVMTVNVSRRPVPPPIPSADRPVPPVPAASRPVPPPIPVTSPGPGSESGDEMTDAGAHPMSPLSPPAQPKRASYLHDERPGSSDRRIPPIPLMSPTSPQSARPPPPPPPTQAPSHHGDLPLRKLDRNEGETDYEGDYDTDIASGAPHKDALKHTREPSLDDAVGSEPTSARSPTAPHGLPPLPPTAPPRGPPSRGGSIDVPRGAPPPPPGPPPHHVQDEDDDDEYDPYKYTAGSPAVSPPVASPPTFAPPVPRAAPPPPQNPPPQSPPPQFPPPPPQTRPPPPLPPTLPPVPHYEESEGEDDLYSAPPPRKSHDRPPPPPPQAPPQQAPPLPTDRAPPPPPQGPPPAAEAQPRMSMGRKSLEATRALGGRVSMDSPRPSTNNQDFMASDVDLGESSHWWTQPKMLPPSLQSRKDVLVDMQESRSDNVVEKLISVLYMDYSQTVISARFDAGNVSDVELAQRQEPPPSRLRPDQLESAYEQFGRRIAKDAEAKQGTIVGAGTPYALVDELLKPYQDALGPVSTRAYGALVYANLANASTQVFDEIRPGDLITFRNAKFQGKQGAMHAKYAVDVGKPDHVAVVYEWDGSKKKVRVWEQGREHKKVKPESFRMGDLRSGEVRVWRVVERRWVGWP